MKKKRIFVDMDGVIADLLGSWVVEYNKLYNDNLKISDIKEWDLTKCVKEEARPYVFDIFKKENFYSNLKVIRGSQEVLRELSVEYDLYILSDPFIKESLVQKWEWIERYFRFISCGNIIFTGSKYVVGTEDDYLIDDKVENLEGFRGKGILYSHEFNKDCREFTRVNNWKEIREYFSEVLENAA